MPEEFDPTKYILNLSKKIAKLTKEYVGLPFNSSNQPPFTIDANRVASQSKFYSTKRKWKRGDPLIGFYSPHADQKKMILNLPDGSTLLDLTFPGWEVGILDHAAMDHFFSRRYLFGDLYGHFLNGRPLKMPTSPLEPRGPVQKEPDQAELERLSAALQRQSEIFQRRRRSLAEAAEKQQQRGVPFDSVPEVPELPSRPRKSRIKSDSVPVNLDSLDDAIEREKAGADGRVLRNVQVHHKSTTDANGSRSKVTITKTFSNGEVEVTERYGDGSEPLEQNLDKLMSDAFDQPSKE